jgi:pseudouridine synthase
MNKPAGFLCTASDDRGRKTVLDLVRVRGRIWPVGRLDEDSEGLLLLTDDGALTNLLTHPRYEVPKTYDLRIRGTVTPDDVRKVERGVWLSEGRSGPARMRVRRQGKDISHVEITLREGRNREVRRIFARLHHPVLSLRRTALGPLDLGGLKPGQVRRLDPREVRALFREALSPRGTGERPSEHLPPPRPSKGGARRGPPRGQRRGPPRDPRRAPARGGRRAPPRGPRRAPRRGGG